MTTQLKELEQKSLPVEEAVGNAQTVFIPSADILESTEHFIVFADMPGVNESSLDITLEKNVLTIEGSVVPSTFPELRLAYSEFIPGNYRRVLHLSNDIDRENIQATVKNGVLKLMLPKSKTSQVKRITVIAE